MAPSAGDPGAIPKIRRARSTVSAPLPEGWFFKDSITLFPPFQGASVIASSEPVQPDLTTERYAALQGELLDKEFKGYEEHAFERAPLFGRDDAWMRRFQWTPEGADPVMQIQAYYVEDGRGYTATATSRLSDFPKFERYLVEILQGLLIEGGTQKPFPRLESSPEATVLASMHDWSQPHQTT